MGRTVGLWIVLFVLWLLLSGVYTPLLIGFGVGTTTLAVYVAARMEILDREAVPFDLVLAAVPYVPWLAWEVFKSNVEVARVILNPALPVNPAMVRFRATQRTDVGRFIYANSITLTPGTITTDVRGSDFEIHALMSHLVDDTETNEMNRRVAALEGVGR